MLSVSENTCSTVQYNFVLTTSNSSLFQNVHNNLFYNVTVGADELVTIRILIIYFYVYMYVFIQLLLFFFTKININMVNTCVIGEIFKK